MAIFKRLVALAVMAMVVFGLSSCERKITRVESIAQPLTCGECHDGSNLITGKQTQWAESVHGTGEAYVRGTSTSCAGCHSGNAFSDMIAAGLSPDELASGDPDPTRQDCRACHMIHDTYSMDDFALRTTAPVTFYAGNIDGMVYNGGQGNLCVNCHQPRRTIPDAVAGVISGISEHWGPHHGPQSTMLLGLGGAGVSDGGPSGHYGGVQGTCVGCHMGDGGNHTFEPDTDYCEKCHVDIGSNFDYNGVQTEIVALSDSLGAMLLAAGLINENSADGHPVIPPGERTTSAPEDQAMALWNWLYVSHEDKSNGVHNYEYAKALLEAGIALMGPTRLP